LQADAAIRVEDRVFITMTELTPNTTYYVRVRQVVKSDGSTDLTSSNVTLTGLIVAKTLPKGINFIDCWQAESSLGWIGGWVEGWMDGWMDAWMDGCMHG
jgi:hypothetical protein